MPIYEYRCVECDHEFETIQKISEDPLKDCPVCQEAKLVKKISAAGFRLKGGGWYETDFKSGEKRNLSSSSESSSSESSSSESSSSESGSAKSGGSSKDSGGDKSKGGDKAGSSTKQSGGSAKATEAS